MKNRVKLLIASRSYTIIGEDSEEHINKVGKLVDARVKEMADAYPELSNADRAVLAAVNVADEHIKTREKLMRMVETLNQSEQELHQKLEQLSQEVEELKLNLEEAEKQKAELEAAAVIEDEDPEEEIEVVFDMGRHQENRDSAGISDMFGSSDVEETAEDTTEETAYDDDIDDPLEEETDEGDAEDSEDAEEESDLDDWDGVGYLREEPNPSEDDALLFGDDEPGSADKDEIEEELDEIEAEDEDAGQEDDESEDEEDEEDEDPLDRFADEAELESPEVPETDEMMPVDSADWQPEEPGVHQTSFDFGDEPETEEEELYPDTSLLDDNRYDGYKED